LQANQRETQKLIGWTTDAANERIRSGSGNAIIQAVLQAHSISQARKLIEVSEVPDAAPDTISLCRLPQIR